MAVPYTGDFYRTVGAGRQTTAPIIPHSRPTSRPPSRSNTPKLPGGTEAILNSTNSTASSTASTNPRSFGTNAQASSSTPSLTTGVSSTQHANLSVEALAAAHKPFPPTLSKPAPSSSSSPSPSSATTTTPAKTKSTDDFNFVPSFPPRLANFGRKISQMSTDFINDLNDDAPWESPNSPSKSLPPATGQGQRGVGGEVPGMGDEPVMCPFCDKPLPPALFASHHDIHNSTSKSGVKSGQGNGDRPIGLKRSNTTTGGRGPGGSTLAGRSSLGKNSQLMESLPVSTPSPSQGVEVKGVQEKITSEGLTGVVSDAEGVNINASKCVVSDSDLEKWFKLAGIPLPETLKPKPTSIPLTEVNGTDDQSGKAVPKRLASIGEDRPIASRSSSTSSGRFAFFKKSAASKKDVGSGDEDSDDETGGGGYAKLLAAGSDTEDEDQGEKRILNKNQEERIEELHDEPDAMTAAPTPEEQDVKAQKEEEPAPAMSEEELKSLLKEVLEKVAEMSQSHGSLLTSQSTILTSLKIARSNLAMAEANNEVLEAELKQAKAVSQTPQAPGRTGQTPFTPATNNGTRMPPPGTIPGRTSEDRQRPMSMHSSTTTSSVSSSVPEKSGGWGFWNKDTKKKLPGGITLPSPSQIANSFPSPSLENLSLDFTSGAPYSAALPVKPVSGDVKRISSEGLQRSASYTHLPLSPPKANAMGPPPAPLISKADLAALKKTLAMAEARIEIMNRELTDLKKGKVEMEAELENLSQALFEEANKMVADERRKLAEVQENLKEVKEERDALKQTIKVLGGQGGSGGEDDRSIKSGKSGKSGKEGDEEDLPDEFMPRDLDKHYEALRKSIHHVSDGTSGVEGGRTGHLTSLGMTTLSTTKEEKEKEREEGGEEELDTVINERSNPMDEYPIESGTNSVQYEDEDVDDDDPVGEVDVEKLPGRRGGIVIAEDPNPWAIPVSTTTTSPQGALGLAGTAPLPGEEKLRS